MPDLPAAQKKVEEVLAEQHTQAEKLRASQSQHLRKEKAASLRWHKHAAGLALKLYRSRAVASCSAAFA